MLAEVQPRNSQRNRNSSEKRVVKGSLFSESRRQSNEASAGTHINKNLDEDIKQKKANLIEAITKPVLGNGRKTLPQEVENTNFNLQQNEENRPTSVDAEEKHSDILVKSEFDRNDSLKFIKDTLQRKNKPLQNETPRGGHLDLPSKQNRVVGLKKPPTANLANKLGFMQIEQTPLGSYES